jgi:hypothetical protein
VVKAEVKVFKLGNVPEPEELMEVTEVSVASDQDLKRKENLAMFTHLHHTLIRTNWHFMKEVEAQVESKMSNWEAKVEALFGSVLPTQFT